MGDVFQPDKLIRIKILGGEKLLKDNWESWFRAFDNFILINNLEDVLEVKEKLNNGTINPKTMERDFKKKNAIVCIKIIKSIEVIDRNNIGIRKTCGEQLQALKNRYED